MHLQSSKSSFKAALINYNRSTSRKENSKPINYQYDLDLIKKGIVFFQPQYITLFSRSVIFVSRHWDVKWHHHWRHNIWEGVIGDLSMCAETLSNWFLSSVKLPNGMGKKTSNKTKNDKQIVGVSKHMNVYKTRYSIVLCSHVRRCCRRSVRKSCVLYYHLMHLIIVIYLYWPLAIYFSEFCFAVSQTLHL